MNVLQSMCFKNLVVVYMTPFNHSTILYCKYCIHCTGKISSQFYFRPVVRGKLKTGRIELHINEYIKKIGEFANSRLGETVSDLCKGKIKDRAVYTIKVFYIL